jgi:hypothetical protein
VLFPDESFTLDFPMRIEHLYIPAVERREGFFSLAEEGLLTGGINEEKALPGSSGRPGETQKILVNIRDKM